MAGQSPIKHLNDDNFQDSIKDGVILVDFYADWCGPCRMIAPIVEELAQELQGKAAIGKVDIEQAQEVTSEQGITHVPTLILYKNGSEFKRVSGVKDKETLLSLINSAL